MEKTFCDYCGVEMPETEVEVAAPKDYLDEETLKQIREDCDTPKWVPTTHVDLRTTDGDEVVDCCFICLIRLLKAARNDRLTAMATFPPEASS